MADRLTPPRHGLRRLSSRLFPSHHHSEESAFAWLAKDPVFAGASTTPGW